MVSIMFRRCFGYLLIALFGLSTVLCPVVEAADVWQCEGRTCAVRLGGCCCVVPGGQKDPDCGQPARQSAPTTPGFACADGCGCVQVITDCDAHNAAVTPVKSFSFGFAVLPAPVTVYVAPALTDVVAHTIEARGPPVLAVALSSPSLRAPPVA